MNIKKYVIKMDTRCNAHPLGFRGENNAFIGCDEVCTHRKCTDCVMDSMIGTDENGYREPVPYGDSTLIQVLRIEP